jgi:hypothetical protein
MSTAHKIQLLREVFQDLSDDQLSGLIDKVNAKKLELNDGKLLDESYSQAITKASLSGGGKAEVLARLVGFLVGIK